MGRIVVYVGSDREVPAIIKKVNGNGTVCLRTIEDRAAWDRDLIAIPFSAEPTPGCWHWPPRV
jgi:hypothetical protein